MSQKYFDKLPIWILYYNLGQRNVLVWGSKNIDDTVETRKKWGIQMKVTDHIMWVTWLLLRVRDTGTGGQG